MMRTSSGNGNGNSGINNSLLPTTMMNNNNNNNGNSLLSMNDDNNNSNNNNNNGINTSSSSSSNSNTNNGVISMSSFKLLLLIMMVLQNSATVLVGRYTRTAVSDKSLLYDVNHLIVIIELGKLLLSCIFEYYYTNGKLLHSIQIYIINHPMDTMKILIPALLYLIQNTLLYIALSNLTAPIFQVTYQAKLVTTAIVSVFLLRRTYTIQQWICLILLSLGVAIVVLGEQKESSSSGGRRILAEVIAANAQNLVIGLTAVSIACFSSALAGVYFEMVLKVQSTTPSNNNTTTTTTNADGTKVTTQPTPPPPPASLWMRNIQLSFFSIVIAIVQGWMKGGTTKDASIQHQSYLHGFTFWTWVLVLLQAGGGLLVAAVIKYADNVLKGLATGVSVVFASLVSVILFNTPLSNQFIFGATMILGAVYYFSNPLPTSITNILFPPTGKDKIETEYNIETKSLLPK